MYSETKNIFSILSFYFHLQKQQASITKTTGSSTLVPSLLFSYPLSSCIAFIVSLALMAMVGIRIFTIADEYIATTFSPA